LIDAAAERQIKHLGSALHQSARLQDSSDVGISSPDASGK